MEETATRKLPPVLEVLIVAAVILAINVSTNWLINPIMIRLIRKAVWSVTWISFLRGILSLFLGGLICFKLLEKRPVGLGAILLIALVYQLLTWMPNTMITNYVARFGDVALARYAQISAYVTPVWSAAVMTFAVYLLTAPRKEVFSSEPSVQIGLVAHVLLLLFTCGIWHMIWIYRTTRYLNCTPGEPYRNPGTKLLLCLLIPFYAIYWVYQSAKRIDRLAQSVCINSDLAVACLILEIFVPLIPPILMQDKINKIVAASQTHPEF